MLKAAGSCVKTAGISCGRGEKREKMVYDLIQERAESDPVAIFGSDYAELQWEKREVINTKI